MAALLAIFLVASSIVSLATMHWAGTGGSASGAHPARYLVTAVLLHDAPTSTGTAGMSTSQVEARWLAHNGVSRTGNVTVSDGSVAGAAVRVWTDASGQLAAPPPQQVTSAGKAALAAVASVITVLLLLLCTGLGIHSATDQRRLAAWEADWSATGPRWTSRR